MVKLAINTLSQKELFLNQSMHEDAWRVLFEEGLLAPVLGFGQLSMLARLNNRFHAMYRGSWRLIWNARSKSLSIEDFGPILRFVIHQRKVEHTKTILHTLVLSGNYQWLSQYFFDVHIESPTYLLLAVDTGEAEIVDVLLEVGGRELVSMKRLDGTSCLLSSIEMAHKKARREIKNTAWGLQQTYRYSAHDLTIVHKLLNFGQLELAKMLRDDGIGPLYMTAEKGQLSVFKRLVHDCGLEYLLHCAQEGFSCLSVAAQEGHVHVVRYLHELVQHTPIWTQLLLMRDNKGETCLHASCKNGHIAVNKYLFQSLLTSPGAKELPYVQLHDGTTCLYHAAMQGHLATVSKIVGGTDERLLQMRCLGKSCVWIAAKGGYLDVVKVLLSAARTPESRRDLLMDKCNKGTALHAAVYSGNLRLVNFLLLEGGRELVMMTSSTGFTCLHIATDGNLGSLPCRLEIVDALFKVGGKDLLLTVCEQKRSVLFMCAASGDAIMTRHVLELDADSSRELLFLTDAYGLSCLLAACGRKHVDTVKYLLQRGKRKLATMEAHDGTSCLDMCLQSNFHEMTALFWEYGKSGSSSKHPGLRHLRHSSTMKHLEKP